MSTVGLHTTTVPSRRVLHWAAIIGSAAAAVVIGLLTARSFFYTVTDSKAGANATPSSIRYSASAGNLRNCALPCH